MLTNPNCEYGANFVAIHSLAAWSKCTVDGCSSLSRNDAVSADIKLELGTLGSGGGGGESSEEVVVPPPPPDKLPPQDEETFALLARGDLEGIFQLESSGMRQIVRDLKPSSLEDISSILALL